MKEMVTPIIKEVMCGGKNMLEEFELSTISATLDLTTIYTVIVFVILLFGILCVGLVVMMFRFRQKKKKEFDDWIIDSDLICQDGLKSNSVSGSLYSLYTEDITNGRYEGSNVLLSKLATSSPKKWSDATKLYVVKILKNVSKDNILNILGLCSRGLEAHFVFSSPGRGSLHRTLKNARFDLDLNLKISLAADLVDGVSYLHNKSILHCFLTCQNCFLDGGWSIKIGNWADSSVYLREERDLIKNMYKVEESLKPSESARIFYADPRCFHGDFDQSSDIFSVGLLIFEIFTVKVSETVTDPEMIRILKKKLDTAEILLHRKSNRIQDNIMSIVKSCIGSVSGRPNLKLTHNFLISLLGKKKGIVDMLMESVEHYMNHLEEKIDERTSKLREQTKALEDVTAKMETLLFEILPPPIARQLINGETVKPEVFECVTIFFSDVVGFTDLCSKLTPSQVMTFLNDLWMLFDGVTSNYDVYKIDTIGDAYMVGSGLPQKNGLQHLKEISNMSLSILKAFPLLRSSELPPGVNLQVRIGIHSGPVTAGVIGNRMPQYCVFGDTVNTASRMESNSLPMKIQISKQSADMLVKTFSGFNLRYRGTIEAKGKGILETYWLTSSNYVNECIQPTERLVTTAKKSESSWKPRKLNNRNFQSSDTRQMTSLKDFNTPLFNEIQTTSSIIQSLDGTQTEQQIDEVESWLDAAHSEAKSEDQGIFKLWLNNNTDKL